jgi:hypothetical protein
VEGIYIYIYKRLYIRTSQMEEGGGGREEDDKEE